MKKWLSVSFLAWILSIASCEKSEPTPDPCKGAQPFEADFTIFEAVGDSLVATDKVLSVVPWADAAILGKYVGSYERTPHLIDTVEISYSTTAESPDPLGEFKVLNVNRGCDIDKYPHGACPAWARGYRAFAIFTDLCKKCPGTKGLIKLIDENTVEANITYGDTIKWGSWPLPELVDKFTGLRLAK